MCHKTVFFLYKMQFDKVQESYKQIRTSMRLHSPTYQGQPAETEEMTYYSHLQKHPFSLKKLIILEKGEFLLAL